MTMKQVFLAAAIALSSCAATSAQVMPCAGDITGDSHVNVDDLVQVILSWGPCPGDDGQMGHGDPSSPPAAPGCPADIAPEGSLDRVVNVDDLVLVILTWGQCNVPPPGVQGQGYVVWCEDWSNMNYLRWTSAYNQDSNPCTVSGFDTTLFNSPAVSHKSQITCAGGVNGVHRGYGGLRFQGENTLPSFAIPSTGGIDATYGLVIQWRAYLSVPYLFDAQGQDLWMSMMTVTDDCSNAWHRVITVNIDNQSMRAHPQHVDGFLYEPNAPAFPRDQWVRVTVYVNLYTGQIHLWQNGTKVVRGWFERPSGQTCQYHFGLYGSGSNWDITYYEDDLRIIKLTQPLTDFAGEPTFPGLTSTCAEP